MAFIADDIIAASIIGGAALGGAGISAASTKKPSSSTHLAKLNLKYGKLYDEWAAKNMPAFNRAGMEAAGFNPILAITAGQAAHGMANTPGHGAYDASGGAGSQIASGVSSALNAYYDLQQKRENVALTKEETKLKEAQTKMTNFQRENPSNPLQFLLSGRDKLRQFGEYIGEKAGSWIGNKLYPVPSSSASGNYNRNINRNRNNNKNRNRNHNHNRNTNTIYINLGGSASSGSGASANSIIGPVNSDY